MAATLLVSMTTLVTWIPHKAFDPATVDLDPSREDDGRKLGEVKV
ncbi:hypothetical protein SAMN05421507_12578 [Lentzea jiangxiensis]|uniref:Uncharacterized protein n=1 Tax=Lentzea jiangxiensis TaxID=641025 RepID=A0A1H0WXZ1_9PSEU|nr:hypothetical protein SAMN05421507_12578 [Lentzea jiangxiensis]